MLNTTTEIAALTALIGSSTAQALILGNRGAAGLVWGSMSNFGAMSAIKGCVAAATPAWLRETFGLRSKEIDGALGVALALDDKSSHHKRPATSACGIACNVARDYKGLPVRFPLSGKRSICEVQTLTALCEKGSTLGSV